MNVFRLPEALPAWCKYLSAIVLLLFLFLEGMTSPLNHDEDHYLAGAVMAQEHQIYTDFTYSAMPLHPILMGAWLNVFPTDHPFLVFRVMSALLMWLAAILLYLTLRRMTAHEGIALLLSSFLALNTLVLYSTNGLISCHIPALTLCLGGAYALQRALAEGSNRWAFFCGLLLCTAAGFKLYYFLLLPVLQCLLLLQAWRGIPGRRSLWLAYALGAILAGIPVLVVFFRDPYAFLFNNYIFHQYNTAWRISIGELGRISLASRIGYTLEKLAYAGNGAVAIGLLCTGWLLGRSRLLRQISALGAPPFFWLVLAITATIGAMLPRPMHLHYLVLPLPFYILLLASLYPALGETLRNRLKRVLILCAVVVLVSGGRYVFQAGLEGLLPARWVPIAVYAEAQKIRRALEIYPEPKHVTTLNPLLAIEAGLPFEEAFAGGPFFFRLGDTLPEEIQERMGLIQQGHAIPLLEATMPEGVLIGFSAAQEAEFKTFLRDHAYELWPERIHGKGQLYVRPVQ